MTRAEYAIKLDTEKYYFMPFEVDSTFFKAIADEDMKQEDFFKQPDTQFSVAGYQYTEIDQNSIWLMIKQQRTALTEVIKRYENLQKTQIESRREKSLPKIDEVIQEIKNDNTHDKN